MAPLRNGVRGVLNHRVIFGGGRAANAGKISGKGRGVTSLRKGVGGLTPED